MMDKTDSSLFIAGGVVISLMWLAWQIKEPTSPTLGKLAILGIIGVIFFAALQIR